MDELSARLAAMAGIDRAVAEKTAGAILGFLRDKGPPEQVQTLINAISHGQAAIETSRSCAGLNGMMDGGLMALGTRLMSLGLSMRQIQNIAREFLGYGRGKIGADKIAAIVIGTPGLSHFA